MYGLTDQQISAIKQVFASIPEVNSAIIYGSRARGDNKPYSDLDITIEGSQLSHSHLTRIEMMLDDLLLPFRIDLSDKRTITNTALLESIQREGKFLK